MVESMSVERLRERLEEDPPQVVDVRTPRAFWQGHLPGAVNLPLPRLPDRVESVAFEEEVVCVCPKGESSLRAARLLEAYEGVAEDATVYNLDAGLRAWDGPIERGSGDAGGGERGGGDDADGGRTDHGDADEPPF